MVTENRFPDNDNIIGSGDFHYFPQASLLQSDGIHFDYADFRSKLLRQALHESNDLLGGFIDSFGLFMVNCARIGIFFI